MGLELDDKFDFKVDFPDGSKATMRFKNGQITIIGTRALVVSKTGENVVTISRIMKGDKK